MTTSHKSTQQLWFLLAALLVVALGLRHAPKLGAQQVKKVAYESDHVLCLAFSNDSKLLAAGGMDKNVRLWDMNNNTLLRTLTGPKGTVRSVAFAPNGLTVAATSDDSKIYIWDVPKGKLMQTLEATGLLMCVAYAPDGKTLASSSFRQMEHKPDHFECEVKLWDVETGKPKRTLIQQDGGAEGLAFTKDGKTLAVALGPSKVGGGFRGIKLLDPETSKEKRSFPFEHGSPMSVAFSADGKWLASGGGLCKPLDATSCMPTGTLAVWEMDSGKSLWLVKDGDNGYFRSVAFSPNGTRLLTGASGPRKEFREGNRVYTKVVNETMLWECKTGKLLWKVEGDVGDVHAVAFSPDGASIASCDGDCLKLSDPDRGMLREVLFRYTLKPIRP